MAPARGLLTKYEHDYTGAFREETTSACGGEKGGERGRERQRGAEESAVVELIVKIRDGAEDLVPFSRDPNFCCLMRADHSGRPDSTKPHGVRRASPTFRERAFLLLLPLLLLLFEQSQVNISKSLVYIQPTRTGSD